MEKPKWLDAGFVMKAASLGFFALAIISGSFSLEGTLDAYFIAPTMALADFLQDIHSISEYFSMLVIGAFVVLAVGLMQANVLKFSDIEKGLYWIVLFFASGVASLFAALIIGGLMLALGIRSYGVFLFLGAFVFVFSTEFLGILKRPPK